MKLALRLFADSQIEVCAKSCATLKREKSALLGRWRRDGFQNASKPEITWAKGEVVELNLECYDH